MRKQPLLVPGLVLLIVGAVLLAVGVCVSLYGVLSRDYAIVLMSVAVPLLVSGASLLANTYTHYYLSIETSEVLRSKGEHKEELNKVINEFLESLISKMDIKRIDEMKPLGTYLDQGIPRVDSQVCVLIDELRGKYGELWSDIEYHWPGTTGDLDRMCERIKKFNEDSERVKDKIKEFINYKLKSRLHYPGLRYEGLTEVCLEVFDKILYGVLYGGTAKLPSADKLTSMINEKLYHRVQERALWVRDINIGEVSEHEWKTQLKEEVVDVIRETTLTNFNTIKELMKKAKELSRESTNTLKGVAKKLRDALNTTYLPNPTCKYVKTLKPTKKRKCVGLVS